MSVAESGNGACNDGEGGDGTNDKDDDNVDDNDSY